MFNPSEVQVIPSLERIAVLTALIAEDGPFDACTLILWKNNIDPDENTVIGDLVEADYTGYAAVAGIAFGTPYYDVDGSAIVTGPSHEFVGTGDTVANVIYGWALVNVGKTVLRKVSKLAEPVGISMAGQGTTVVPWLRYDGR